MIEQSILSPTYQCDKDFQHQFFNEGSRLVYGTSGLGGVWGKVDEGESIDCLIYGLENGISALDTSPSYSRSEEFIGKALKQWKGKTPFISTKVGRLPAEKADELYVDYSPQSLRNSLMRSLDLLGVDQVDLLFLHEPQHVPLDNIEEILETLKSFKEEGYTNLIGVGGNPTNDFRKYILKDNFQVISGFLKMDACNLSAFEKDIPYIQQEGIAYYAASALHMSLLGRRFETYVNNPPDTEWITRQDIKTAKAIKQVADQYQMPLSHLAQRYLFSIKEADRVVVGARNIQQIQSTVTDWQAGVLPLEVFEAVTEMIIKTRK